MPQTSSWRNAKVLLYLLAIGSPLAFYTWMALINNFAIDEVNFTGVEMGILQSLREIPGFLAFTVVFVLLFFREQTFTIISLCMMGIGTAITGFFPTIYGLYFTTVLMSVGFHYFETLQGSLQLQWLSKEEAPKILGRIVAVGSFAGLVSFGMIYFATEVFDLAMKWIYLIGGGVAIAIAVIAWLVFPTMPAKVEQHKTLILRKRYWLYYALQFMSGARRQIFMVFAGFLMVEKFGYDPAAMALMFLANGALTMVTAPYVGKLIGRFGERRMLSFEYIGLVGVFVAYAFVEHPGIAVALYILDHLFFSIAIAMKTYFQKIADPQDIASTQGVVFTINHIAAVVLPVAYGFLWVISPAAVFLTGAGLAAMSFVLARMVPLAPTPDNVALINFGRVSVKPAE